MDEYFQELFQTQSYSTIISTKNVLVSFFLFLERNYHFKNPMPELTFNFNSLKPFPKPTTIITRHEVLKLLNSMVTHSKHLKRDLIFFCLLLSTGRRISEVLHLKVEHFDFKFNTYKLIKTKSKRQFIVPMMNGMGEAIELYCKQNELLPTSYLIQHDDGKPFTRIQTSDLFKKFCALAGIKKFNIHATRKTFATLLYEEKVDITVIQQFLNHVRSDTTQDYVKSNYVRNYGLKVKANQELYSKFKKIRE
jgi:integrase